MTRAPVLPLAAAALGIAIYSGMDTLMKRLSIESGAYAAVLWRSVAGVAITGVLFLVRRQHWPRDAALRLHVGRGLAAGLSVLLFFYGLARVPMAEAVALTFLAPLIALYLASAMLGERVRRGAWFGSAIAFIGVLVIALAAARAHVDHQAVLGMVAIFVASILYGLSLILLRRQAQAADPVEVTLFTSLVIGIVMLPGAPWLAGAPHASQLPAVAGAALLGTVSALLIAWAYARAEAQSLATMEYSAFVWSALLGWIVFGERLTLGTLAGTLLIVAGCLVAVRRPQAPVASSEAAA